MNLIMQVAYVKTQLCRLREIDYNAFDFFLSGKLMFDPLSFNDFPEITSQEVDVELRMK